MRSLSVAASTKLNAQYGTEPIIIVEIQWVDGGGRLAYADRKIAPSVLGQIVDISSIDSVVKADGSSDSSQVQLTLDDTDGAIKAIADTHDLHKRPVWIYQWFDGLDLSDKFLLCKGEINSPFSWDEGDRTVSFDVTSRIEDVEVGFSMEEGDFPIVPPYALGKAWPLVFGSVCDVPVLQVRAPRYGILQSGEGIRDYTLESRICQARYIQCANVPVGTTTTVTPSTGVKPGTTVEFPDVGKIDVWTFDTETSQVWAPDASCVEDRFYIICDLIYQWQQQIAYEHPTMVVRGATEVFPQHELITLNIEGGLFTGQFDGDTFMITERVHPDAALLPASICSPVNDRAFHVGYTLESGYWVQTNSGSAWYDSRTVTSDPREIDNYCNRAIQSQIAQHSEGGPVSSRKAFDDMVAGSFFWAHAGSKVYLESDAQVLYIVNLLPCTITRVAAMKQTAAGPKLMTVPASYYTIYETDYDGYTVSEIGMTKPLSQRSEVVTNKDGTKRTVTSKWSDDLYVSVTSSVGPNPVDIITWLLGKYTSVTPDTESFDHVRTRLANYPSQFALLERKNVMDLIADIAYQSRCVAYVRNDVMYLKYVSEEPTSVATLSESDIHANSLMVSLSSTDDVATKHVVNWSRSKSESDLKIILKHNVAKYGTHATTHDYYTQNIYENVLKSATFWMIRDANVWKTVEFSTPVKHLALEVFDCVTLDLPDLAPQPVKAIITSMKYDVANEKIDFTCWTPLKAGETSPYIHAWPADIAPLTIFPTAEERAAGLGYEFTVTPPETHILFIAQADEGVPPPVLTSGDPHPSDLDDALGTCFCPISDEVVIEEDDPVFDALKKAEKANRDQQQSKMDAPAAAGGTNDSKEKPKRVCGQVSHGESCVYEVRVGYITADLVGLGNHGCGGPCDHTQTKGIVCTLSQTNVCHSFGALFSATMFASQMRAQIQQHTHDCGGGPVFWAASGETFPGFVSNPTAIGDGCESSPGDSTKPNQGETSKPAKAP